MVTIERMPSNAEKLAGPGHFMEINPMVTKQMDEASKIKELTQKLSQGNEDQRVLAENQDKFVAHGNSQNGFKLTYAGADIKPLQRSVDSLFGTGKVEVSQTKTLPPEMLGDERLIAKRELLEQAL